MAWIKGRQQSGYDKLKIISFLFFDMYLIRFSKGSEIKEHIDAVDNKRHFRCNIILKKAAQGGEFRCTQNLVNILNRVYIFRPDKETHSVTRIESGKRYVFSFGIAL